MDKIDELIQSGQKLDFRNNSYSTSHGTYTRASDELLSWVATIEDFICNTYGEESAAFKLYLTFDRTKLNEYEQGDFEEQKAILNGALKACKNIVPKNKTTQVDDNLIIQLIKNIYFWPALIVITSSAFSLGLYFGVTKFDKEKSEFYEMTKKQEVEINSLKNDLQSKTTTIKLLRNSLHKK